MVHVLFTARPCQVAVLSKLSTSFIAGNPCSQAWLNAHAPQTIRSPVPAPQHTTMKQQESSSKPANLTVKVSRKNRVENQHSLWIKPCCRHLALPVSVIMLNVVPAFFVPYICDVIHNISCVEHKVPAHNIEDTRWVICTGTLRR